MNRQTGVSIVRLVAAILLLSSGCLAFPAFDFSPEYFARIGTDAISLCNERLAAIVHIPADKRTFENTVKAFEEATVAFKDMVHLPQFMSSVHSDKAVRSAASGLAKVTERFLVDIGTRRDLYLAIRELADRKPPLDAEDQLLLDRKLIDFQRNGLALPDEQLEEYRALKERLGDVEWKFVAVIKVWDTARRESDSRKPDENLINRCKEKNVTLLEEALQIRKRIAGLLGYSSHAALTLADRMAKRPEVVFAFLDHLIERLRPDGKKALKTLVEWKARETDKPVGPISDKELVKYAQLYKKSVFGFDEEVLAEFFQLDHLLVSMFDIFETIFGVTFRRANLPTWNKDVTAYEVCDKANGLVGYLYLDLLLREGKYEAPSCWVLENTRIQPDGSRRKPSVAICMSFPHPVASAALLLKHEDVESLFHEFGHAFHNLFSRARYESLAGTAVSLDFVEVPSTLLEKWAWQPEVLKKISRHSQTGQQLPDALIRKLIESRAFDRGLVLLHQLFVSRFDMVIHTIEVKNTSALFEEMQSEILMTTAADRCRQAGIPHLMNGYDANYYGYLWGEMLSSDIFSEFEKAGLFDSATGKKFRDVVLAPGRVADDAALVAAFLGRPFNEDAFIRQLSLSR